VDWITQNLNIRNTLVDKEALEKYGEIERIFNVQLFNKLLYIKHAVIIQVYTNIFIHK
jgi:hypothetical protein